MLRQTVKVESLCAGSDTSRYESVDSDKEGTSSDDASDEACEQENSKFDWTNYPAT